MKTNIFFIFILGLLISVQTSAQEISVVDVKRNITLADEDPVYKDFYINAGEGSSLRKNMVVNVKRKINVKDAGTKSVGDFETVVGQLKIVQIGNKVSVAREFKLISRDEEAMLEQIGIMSGDRIDLNGSFIDYSKPNYKRKTSEAEPVKEEGPETKTADAGSVMTPPSDTAAPEQNKQEREPANQQVVPQGLPGKQNAIPLTEI
ncbi:hypothetical protein K2P97_04480 [bacterium]|nr:hypothetical protein [bacterium]